MKPRDASVPGVASGTMGVLLLEHSWLPRSRGLEFSWVKGNDPGFHIIQKHRAENHQVLVCSPWLDPVPSLPRAQVKWTLLRGPPSPQAGCVRVSLHTSCCEQLPVRSASVLGCRGSDLKEPTPVHPRAIATHTQSHRCALLSFLPYSS